MKKKILIALGVFSMVAILTLNVNLSKSDHESIISLTNLSLIPEAQGEDSSGGYCTFAWSYCDWGGSEYSLMRYTR